MSVFEKNLSLLKSCQPHVFNKLNAYIRGEYVPLNNSIERIALANQDDIIINMLVTCNGSGHLICDHEDPISQAYNWIDRYVDPSSKADIVFGLGFGYHIEVLITSFKNRRVTVIEPDMELFYQILKVRNMEFIITKADIFVDEPVDAILGKLNTLLWDADKGGIQCQPFEVYGEMFPKLWDDLREKFLKTAHNFNVDISTIRLFGELWVHNNIKNASRLCEASNAWGLAGNFRNIPGILVSAGPSLSKNVHLLKELKSKAVIMAAGTAVNVLERYGVTPHFMVGTDGTEGEAEIHKKVQSRDIYFIYSNQVATGSVESYKGPKYFMNFPVDVYSERFLKYAGIHSELFASGPSVANTCFDLLLKMGCNPIILVGQDLAFTGGIKYAGEEVQGQAHDDSADYEKKGYTLTKDIYGQDIYTRADFMSMKNWFEMYFEKAKDMVDIINATEGGLNIGFARNDTLGSVIRKGSFREVDIESKIREIYKSNLFGEEVKNKLKAYNESIYQEIERLSQCSKRQKKLADLIKRDVYHPVRDKKAFKRTVEEISTLADAVIESPIYDSVLKRIIEIEFYLIKVELERALKETSNYGSVKGAYMNAIERQNSMLEQKLQKIKNMLL